MTNERKGNVENESLGLSNDTQISQRNTAVDENVQNNTKAEKMTPLMSGPGESQNQKVKNSKQPVNEGNENKDAIKRKNNDCNEHKVRAREQEIVRPETKGQNDTQVPQFLTDTVTEAKSQAPQRKNKGKN